MTVASSVADNQTLSQMFLDLYLKDPSSNPFGQFYTNPYAGSLVGELPRAYEQYGRLAHPNKLAKQLLSAGGPREVSQAGRELIAQTKDLRRSNYESYKQPYTEAKELYRELRDAGFESPEAQEQARQGLAAVREATFLPYLAKRGYLQAQERLQESGINQAKGRARLDLLRESMAARGMSAEDIKESTKGFRQNLRKRRERDRESWHAVKNVGRGGEVELGDQMTLGESLNRMMSEAASSIRPEMGASIRSQAGVGSSNLANAQPRAQESTTGTGLGGQIAGVAAALGETIRSGRSGLDLGVGGSDDVLNSKDIRAAMEGGMSRRDIKRAVKEGDIRMSAKARARLFRNK